MKKFMGLFVSLILIVGILSGCSEANDKDTKSESDNSSKEQTKDAGNSQWPRTIKDATGKEIKFDKKPERVVVLHSLFLDYFFALETPPTASAGATFSKGNKVLDGFETLKPYVGTASVMDLGSARDLNLEAVLKSKPDVIVTFKGHADKVYDKLAKIAPVVQIDFKDSWQNKTMQCAKIVGKEDLANKIINETEKEIKNTKKLLENNKDKTVALLRVDGKGNFVALGSKDTIYYNKEDGFNLSIPKGYPEHSKVVSLEGLSKMNPDYIIFRHFPEIVNSAVEKQKTSPVWQSLNAVKKDQILFFDDSLNSESPLALKISAKNLTKAISK
ncbi:ABC transporter substrate-binding protein [Clostridium botulinum]|uniref:ABC transporter substrate-binding protein n=1 Tax=Clostridium botulinum TaxID=1491 RepID=UPI0007E10A62|nr:ABC transporter substrate-binding protein [Clostridium botulinum]KEI80110.1 ferrichrome ABC transporter [Clostridium botulinum B2 331]NFA89647.1 ABC transporter substrate-binding protein [Clostridium botulinum]NFB20833.1 ABC transporter substrate-binding protein [Clostridium botulinum]NFI39281.1 ABC transporter substrate-binding protein [Clostridium botulinum]NFT55948.1 ABC transporter substrate-binding protein [Clostridium botulinum]